MEHYACFLAFVIKLFELFEYKSMLRGVASRFMVRDWRMDLFDRAAQIFVLEVRARFELLQVIFELKSITLSDKLVCVKLAAELCSNFSPFKSATGLKSPARPAVQLWTTSCANVME